MKRNISVIGAAALAVLALSGCGGGGSNSSTASSSSSSSSSSGGMSSAQQLDSAQVLALAQKTSEVSSPFQVDDGALTLTDTSDSSAPIGVDGM
jgi:hypothetical protein